MPERPRLLSVLTGTDNASQDVGREVSWLELLRQLHQRDLLSNASSQDNCAKAARACMWGKHDVSADAESSAAFVRLYTGDEAPLVNDLERVGNALTIKRDAYRRQHGYRVHERDCAGVECQQARLTDDRCGCVKQYSRGRALMPCTAPQYMMQMCRRTPSEVHASCVVRRVVCGTQLIDTFAMHNGTRRMVACVCEWKRARA